MPAPPATANANIARHLTLMAAAQPQRAALKIPRGRTRQGDIDYLVLSFAELDAEVAAWSAKLTAAGIRRGDWTLLMVRQGLPLIASAFAMFRLGAVPVVIDPGMGFRNFLGCVLQSRPRALVGIPLAQIVSRVFRRHFGSVSIRVSASTSLTSRQARSAPPATTAEPAAAAATDLAAVLFTSGSTGAPKGVCYEHGMFEAQVRLIRQAYGISPGEVDLPLLPIFALFNPALGMTTVVPEIDPRRPAEVDPARIVQAIQQEQVTNSFGSPTLWRKIGDHCITTGTTLPTLRRVLCAGAPVPASLWSTAARWLTKGQLHSPYGATEALPVASVSAPEIDPTAVRGACVGRPVAEIDVRIIRIVDAPLARLADAEPLPAGEIGEIVVRGPVVTKTYDHRPDATAAAKIADDSGALWHRMGDCGYLDVEGRLWFCGRKVERVEAPYGTFFTEPCEQVFRVHPRVTRCALVGVGVPGALRPALVVEAELKDSSACRQFARELATLGQRHAHTDRVTLFYFHPRFPVDVRHNAKIHRLTLARWAATAKGFEIELRK
jgi:acyl-CoA synthetase (AMP-forming)/AMP-acid ligase II